MPNHPIIIVGAGMAGLACATWLRRAGRTVLLLEAADAVGGRVRTDLTPEGFRLDRGFQVLLTDYPEARRLFDYGALQLRPFTSGAVVRLADGRETTLKNPLQQPMAAFSALASPIGTLADKLLIIKLAQQVQQAAPEALLARSGTTTLEFLRRYGWSEQIINSFFRPFFGGVFLNRDLGTASNFFEFVFQQFLRGDAAVPALGMQQLPEQLAAHLPAGSLRLNTPVARIDGRTVHLENGETLEAAAVVLAVDGSVPAQLLPGLTLPEQGRIAPPRRTTCTYFSGPASSAPYVDKLLRLNALPTSLAHNVAFPAEVSPAYAPAGHALISVSTHGEHGLSEADLTTHLRHELRAWFGPRVRHWEHLRTYHIANALPEYRPGEPSHALKLADGLYRCGDWAAYPSLNAALATGRQAASQIQTDLTDGPDTPANAG